MSYRIAFPAEMDEGDWALQEAKGWLEAKIVWDGGERTVTFYDQARLMQSISDDMRRLGFFAEPGIVVLPTVTRAGIEAAVAALAERGFVDLQHP
ncbi:hypothetical protein ABH926_001334 [Catenulispora sp. GP43]|uniref:hypothetical protein n=1 Tax=Catenulispora sp. GP43 TaxID=3156263 RepID=UPI0035157AD8